MQSFSPGHVSAVPLTQQGIAALKSGDSAQAYDLLTQALQANPRDEQAWLWLSGVVTSDAERHYCLGRVLEINPQNGAAQRGLSLLPAGLVPLSPLPTPALVQARQAEPPPTPIYAPAPVQARQAEPPPTPIYAPTPAAAPAARPAAEPLLPLGYSNQPAAVVGFAAATFQPFALSGQPDSLLAIIDDDSPSAAPIAPPPAPPMPAGPTYKQADIDFVVRQLGSNRTKDEVSRMLCEQKGYAWHDAQDLVVQVGFKHRTSIARRQSPFLVALGVATIIGGIVLIAYASLSLYTSYMVMSRGVPAAEVEFVARRGRSVVVMFGALGTGILMVLGSLVGIGQTIKAMWK